MNSNSESDIIECEIPRWMLKQLRGCARQSKHNSMTRKGEKDAEHIEHLLTYYLEKESK